VQRTVVAVVQPYDDPGSVRLSARRLQKKLKFLPSLTYERKKGVERGAYLHLKGGLDSGRASI